MSSSQSFKLRDALIAQDDALTKFISDFPQADVQLVRQLIRNARKEAQNNKPPRASRELYRLIHSMVLPPLVLEIKEEEETDE